jgi:hypothetical protein
MTVVAAQITQISEVELDGMQCVEFAVNRVDVLYSVLEGSLHIVLLKKREI